MEKTPGGINDDKIVKKANPMLNQIIERLIYEYRIIKQD